MKIGVLSDTHLKVPDSRLDHILQELFRAYDMILHAGDIVSGSVLERLEEKGVLAVCGNMDDYEVAATLPQKRIIPAGGKRIGLIHGWGGRQGLRERVLERLKPDNPDIVVYGHSHVAFWGEVNGVMMFNPGAAAHNPYGDAGTVGRIEIVDGNVETAFLPINN
jgi:uncharacterized protein